MTKLEILLFIISSLCAIFSVALTSKLYGDRKYISELQKKTDGIEAENEVNKRLKEEFEHKVAEKSFKFVAINQMSKTLAKEKSMRMLKKLILDMLIETNSISRGISFENFNGSLEIFEAKSFDRKDYNYKINRSKDYVLWEELKQKKVMTLKELEKYPQLTDFISQFKDGYWITFITSDENDDEDIRFVVVLGEKVNGEYSSDEEEFLDTLCGQIEIVLENNIKNTYIKEKNEELTEKVYNLMTLNYAAKMVSSTLDMEEILNNAVDMFSEASRATKSMILYYHKELGELEIKGIRGDYPEDLTGHKFHVDNSEVEFMKKYTNILVLTEASEEEIAELSNFYMKNKEIFLSFKHELFIPLVTKDEVLGLLLLGMKYHEEGYKKENIEVYSTLASQVAISLYNAKLYNLAITDGMTKLYLHRYFKSRLAEEMERAKRHNRDISVLMTDIDHFKSFNDTYGHQTGDEVLKSVAAIIKESVRKTDIAARYGGEEFAVVLPETGEEGAKIVAENIRKKIEANVLMNEDKELKVTISIGVYSFSGENNDDDSETMIKKADTALYYSKKTGRNKVTQYLQIKEYADEGEFIK